MAPGRGAGHLLVGSVGRLHKKGQYVHLIVLQHTAATDPAAVQRLPLPAKCRISLPRMSLLIEFWPPDDVPGTKMLVVLS